VAHYEAGLKRDGSIPFVKVHKMEIKLAILGFLSIAAFIVAATVGLSALDNSLIGKLIIAFIVLGGITPWLYLLHQTKGHVSNKKYAFYFVGCWILAPFILLKLGKRKNAP
ncbi:MAG: hypothetical protein KME65_00005, partial [Candidatus Thiodiazotropha sp. (ex Ctena orbiculata)]|nr:hypothetical protein [Candidatus Thiodiazotropha taylori]MBV2138435.1 hypothetical protein [Candidatus Thiodiazotropha taylori]